MDEKEEKAKQLKELLEAERKVDVTIKKLIDATVQRENIMNALHDYNDIKDATQTVIGHLATLQVTTVAEIHDAFHLPRE